MLPQLARNRQQVEVTGERWCRAAMEAEARGQQRPVECPAVVRHQPRLGRQGVLQGVEERLLISVIGQQQLAH